GTDDRIAAVAGLRLRCIEQIATKSVILKSARSRKVHEGGRDIQMTSGERCPVNVRERFRSVNHQRYGELFVKRMSRARGNVLLARVMIPGDREHGAFEFLFGF